MAINSVNNYVGASYPKYLEDKRKRGLALGYLGGASALSGACCHFAKDSLAVKNPKLLFAMTGISFLLSLIGFSGAGKAQKELNEFNKQANILNTKV